MVFKMNVINTYILTLESPGIRRFRGQMTARCSLQTYIIRVCILIDPYRGVRKTQTSEPGKLRPPGCLENTDPRKTSRKPQFLYLDYHVTYSFFHAYVTCLKKPNANMASNVYLLAAVLSIFSLMTVKEIVFPSRVQASNPDNMEKVKKAAAFTGPTIKFLYW